MESIGGRPPIWDDPVKFAQEVDKYFETDKTPTWTGLALHLGFESRQSLEDYKKREGFLTPIKKALLRIENQYEKALLKGNPGGPIFALKNFNWKDKQEVDQNTTHGGSITIGWEKPPLPNIGNKGSEGEL